LNITGLPKGFSIGDLRHRIDIQRKQSNGTWANVFSSVPAMHSPRFPNVGSLYRNVFSFWECGTINSLDRVVKNGENFGIGVVVPVEGLRRATSLFCSEGSNEYQETITLFDRSTGFKNAHGHKEVFWTETEEYKGKIFIDGTQEESDRPSQTIANSVRMLLRYADVSVNQEAEWNNVRYRVAETEYRVWDTLVTLRPAKEVA
jgi:hypothetical protein